MTAGLPRRLSVAAYIVIGFGVCIAALGVVLYSTTRSSLHAERERTFSDLRAAAQAAADDAAATIPESRTFLAAMVADPNINSFDPVRCQTAFSGLAAVGQQANAFVLAPDGRVVCQLNSGPNAMVLPLGDWLRDVKLPGAMPNSVSLDERTGRPTVNLAVAIPGAAGTGALVTVWDAAGYGLEVPAGTTRGVALVQLDSQRSIVISASANAPVKPGRLPASSWMHESLGADTSRVDRDGVTRYYQEVAVEGLDRIVLAGIPRSVALAEAQEESRNNALVAATVVLIVSALGVLMQRRIAKPIQKLQEAITAAAADHVVKAVPQGPTEIAAVAEAFNQTMHERRELEQDLADALKQAQRASKLKSEFLANMSHEIRTPMNGVLGMLSLLEDAEVSEDVRDGLRTMGESANSLMAILNELLDFSKLEAGMVSTETAPFAVRELVRGAISPWVAIAGRKDVPLTATVDPDVPEIVMGDGARVRQILSNLIDNAVKFTNRGRVVVTVKRGAANFLRFEVADSGIGISEDGRHHLFEPFVQADGTTTRRYGGTGLGLAICRQLTEFMGGRIGVDSTEGVGSLFWFELPLPVAVPTAPARNGAAAHHLLPPPATRPTGGPARILIVDDNLVNQKVAVQMLRKLGYDVDAAADGIEALRAIEANGFDAVLMDVQMPHMDGWEATVELRRRGRMLPIIAMTASALEEDRKRCAEVGMDGYVVKPMNLESLSSELTRVLSKREKTVAAVAP